MRTQLVDVLLTDLLRNFYMSNGCKVASVSNKSVNKAVTILHVIYRGFISLVTNLIVPSSLLQVLTACFVLVPTNWRQAVRMELVNSI